MALRRRPSATIRPHDRRQAPLRPMLAGPRPQHPQRSRGFSGQCPRGDGPETERPGQYPPRPQDLRVTAQGTSRQRPTPRRAGRTEPGGAWKRHFSPNHTPQKRILDFRNYGLRRPAVRPQQKCAVRGAAPGKTIRGEAPAGTRHYGAPAEGTERAALTWGANLQTTKSIEPQLTLPACRRPCLPNFRGRDNIKIRVNSGAPSERPEIRAGQPFAQ